jgi:hypothetical protein
MFFIFLCVVIAALIASRLFSKGKYLKTEGVQPPEIDGLFSLILYGANDPKQLVILDIEGDEFLFQVEDSSHTYTVTRGLSAEQSLAEAAKFIDTPNQTMHKIMHEGRPVGYEVRPLFQTVRFGAPDILDVGYRLEGNTVFVTVGIKASVRRNYERDIYGGN